MYQCSGQIHYVHELRVPLLTVNAAFVQSRRALVHPFSGTEPDCYLNSNAPADFFNISVFPARSDGMRTPRQGRPYERNADAWVFRTNRLLHCCRIFLSTGLPMRA